MAGTTTTPSGPTHIVESYHAVENRITQAIEILQARGGQSNLAAAAKEFLLPPQRLRARWNGRPPKTQVIPGNRKLSGHQELAVCQYLDHLDNIGLPADKAEQAQIKAKRKAFLTAVATMRKGMVKVRTVRKKIQKELCKDIRVKAKARAKRLSILPV